MFLTHYYWYVAKASDADISLTTHIEKVSKLLTGSPEDTTVPFPIYKCDSCGHINKGFNPFEETEETKLTLND